MAEQRIAIVTGASRGIGRAIAQRLAQGGHRVFLVSRSKDTLEAVQGEIREAGGEAEVAVCDVVDSDALAQMIRETASTHGRLDVLVNGAGITRDASLLNMTDEDFDEILRVNLKPVFVACRTAAWEMLHGRFGRIINIGSISGVVGHAGQANYAAAKAGLIGFTKTVAIEFARAGITANVIAAGVIETELIDSIPKEQRDKLVKSIPLRRFGRPHEVAHAAEFLASPDAAYITGQVIVVDGGLIG